MLQLTLWFLVLPAMVLLSKIYLYTIYLFIIIIIQIVLFCENRRLKSIDVPTAVLKASPDFCTVYVISKSKISSVRNATRVAPFTSPLREQINALSSHNSFSSDASDSRYSIRSSYTIKGPFSFISFIQYFRNYYFE